MPSPVEVQLSAAELFLAACVGVQRHIQALREGRADRHGANADAGWSLHIEGAAGEMAFAKVAGLYWQAPVGTFRRGGDVGDVQVRTRSTHTYELIVRESDRPDDVFVLVTGRSPTFRVHGWIRARDAQRPEWLAGHGGRPPAYFVPQSALVPLNRAGAKTA